MERKTPLYDVHVEEGGKIVPFAGYLLPVQYGTGVIQEHMAVRQQAGLFDVSHMGEILFTGPTALDTINHLLTNDYNGMAVNKVRYGAMCNADGGTIDDLVVYKFGEERYLAVVNAANREKDYAHMAANVLPGTQCQDISDTVAQLALQGPKAPAILKKLLPEDQIPKGYYTALPKVNLAGMECMISRTGYTGELGYEIYTANENAPKLWKVLREAGEEFGLIPCGLGARDTLRLEAAMPLYGHEMDETVTPLEAGLDFAVKLNKPEFIGKDALVAAGTPPGGAGGPGRHRPGHRPGAPGPLPGRGEDRPYHLRHPLPLPGQGPGHGPHRRQARRRGHRPGGRRPGPPGGGGDRPLPFLQAGLSAPALFDPLCDPKGFPCHPNNILMYGGENHV